MIFIPVIILFIYTVLVILFIVGWKKKTQYEMKERGSTFVTVLVPVRNEEESIGGLLENLENQDYPSDKFEVIVINDFSTDETVSVVKSYQEKKMIELKLLEKSILNDTSPKKNAIKLGVQEALGQLILVTDGDCSVPSKWISLHAKNYEKSGVFFTTGPVSFKEKRSFWNKLMSLEFASLIGTGAASLNLGFPNMSNAANMSFSKKVFEKINGYEGTGETPSGDDEFLMHKIFKIYGRNRISFLKNQDAIVKTQAPRNWKMLLNQRKRWASKWKHYQLHYIKLLAIFIFFTQLSVLSILFFLLIGKGLSTILVVSFIGKMLVEFMFLNSITKFLKQSFSFTSFIFLQFVYPIYVIFFGLVSNFKEFDWKGRKY